MPEIRGKTVVVGMSGGVDSSVAAYLLKEQGYHVIGVTMQLQKWDAESAEPGGCCGTDAAADARRVAQMLDIPFYVLNFQKEFQEHVIDYFVREYRMGRTPNPCIACNRHIKWEALLHRSREIGADYIATGHYARVVTRANGRYAVAVSATEQKDQSYALYNLTQEQLSRTLLPVGDYTKPQIREIAAKLGLLVAEKPDSQEICFVPDNDYAGFIERETGCKEMPGNFVTSDGKVLGQHKGISHYTVGQRKGLGLAMGHPVFVTEICPDTREVIIGEEKAVFSDGLTACQMNYMGEEHFEPGQEFLAKIRYSHRGERCVVESGNEDRVVVRFLEQVRAVTPGQAVVFYQDNAVMGGGVIC